ncbi:MAG: hypothetical protein ACYCV4_02070 [Dermatophilaceae bacterium]
MPWYANSDEVAHVYPELRRADGSTLLLDPGEEVELPVKVSRTHLVPVTHAKTKTTIEEPTDG